MTSMKGVFLFLSIERQKMLKWIVNPDVTDYTYFPVLIQRTIHLCSLAQESGRYVKKN